MPSRQHRQEPQRHQGDIIPARVISGIKDQMAGKPKMDMDATRAALSALTQAQSDKNKATAKPSWLKHEEARRHGDQERLQYQVLTPARAPGPMPRPRSR